MLKKNKYLTKWLNKIGFSAKLATTTVAGRTRTLSLANRQNVD